MQNSNMVAEYIDHMGSDLSVVNSAKSSFGKQDTEFKPKEHTRLINYLATGLSQADRESTMKEIANLGSIYVDSYDGEQYNTDDFSNLVKAIEQYRHTPTHWSPFSHTAITLQLKAPIAIHAQFMKHTVGFSHNTVSRRYVSDTPDYYVPTFRAKPVGNIKQGSGNEFVIKYAIYNGQDKLVASFDTKESADEYIAMSNEYLEISEIYQDDIVRVYKTRLNQCLQSYDELIEIGIAPEQARFILPQGVMTEWVTTGSLYAWSRLYNLRTDSHAQKEIQTLAHMIGLIIEPLFPVSWQALTRDH